MTAYGAAVACEATAGPSHSSYRLNLGNSRKRTPVQGRSKRSKPTIVVLRAAHVRRALADIHGPMLPDSDEGRRHLFAALQCLAPRGDGELALRKFITTTAPWMDDTEASKLLDRVYARPLKFKAETLGRWIGLKDANRTRLGITTIAPVDVTKEQRAARKRIKKAAWRRAKRRSQGMKPRAQYLTESLSRTRPWEAFGIKRRAWERRGKPMPPDHDASLSPSILSSGLGDTLASSVATPQGARASRAKDGGPRCARPAHREAGGMKENVLAGVAA